VKRDSSLPLLRLAQAMSDRAPIDWGQERAAHPALASRIEMLRRIDGVARAFHGDLVPGLLSPGRDLADTEDLVQSFRVRALSHVERLGVRLVGGFLADVRAFLLTQARHEIRRASRRPQGDPIDEAALEAYLDGLARLEPRLQEALVLEIEMGFTNEQAARALGCDTANAARVLVSRALVRLAEEMDQRS
jgi:DNA-directed RNA polymerase specialized sigma24 family protein